MQSSAKSILFTVNSGPQAGVCNGAVGTLRGIGYAPAELNEPSPDDKSTTDVTLTEIPKFLLLELHEKSLLKGRRIGGLPFGVVPVFPEVVSFDFSPEKVHPKFFNNYQAVSQNPLPSKVTVKRRGFTVKMAVAFTDFQIEVSFSRRARRKRSLKPTLSVPQHNTPAGCYDRASPEVPLRPAPNQGGRRAWSIHLLDSDPEFGPVGHRLPVRSPYCVLACCTSANLPYNDLSQVRHLGAAARTFRGAVGGNATTVCPRKRDGDPAPSGDRGPDQANEDGGKSVSPEQQGPGSDVMVRVSVHKPLSVSLQGDQGQHEFNAGELEARRARLPAARGD